MKTTYNEIEIAYSEDDNRWHFELRGRKRTAGSLAKAKEAIDKEPADKRKQTFPRFDAYIFKYGRGHEIVTVTSLSENEWTRQLQFWVSNKKGERSKEDASSLFTVNDKNTAIVAEIARLAAEIEAIEKKKSAQHEKLQTATVPKEIA